MKTIISEKFWPNIAKRWRKMEPPVRPWPSEVKVYHQFAKKILKGVKNPKILILGATPEMRDIAYSFNLCE